MRTVVMSAMAAVLMIGAGAAQSTGTLAGRIVTASGNTPVPDVAIRAKNTATGATLSATTADDGGYSITLPAGAYDIVAEQMFFVPFRQDAVQIDAGRSTQLDIRMNDVQLGTAGDNGEFFVGLLAAKPAATGRTPRTQGKPDLSGVWSPAPWRPLGGPPELLSWADAVTRQRRDDPVTPMVQCLPSGPSYQGLLSYSRILQVRDVMVIVDELFAQPTRTVYLDGRSHPRDPNPSFMGHSIGRWDGDTLVVDSVGFNDRGWLSRGRYPQTEQMHITERYRRPDMGHLEIEMTFDDPGTFTKPWTMKQVRALAPKDLELGELICNENEKDREHLVSR